MDLKRFSVQAIALAVAGLVSGTAFAEGNITLYGLVDLGYTYSKSDFRKFQGIENGLGIAGDSSFLGIEGEEDLGNGLKAVFKFEWDSDADEGGGPTGPRYSYVGLNGDFGTVTLGRNGTPSDLYFGDTAVMGLTGNEPINFFRGAMPIIDGEKWDNSIAYVSPEFSGLEFAATYSFGERVNGSRKTANGYPCGEDEQGDPLYCKSAKTTSGGQFGLGVRYTNGPLYLTAVYHVKANDDSKRNWDDGMDLDYDDPGYGASGWGIGASYDFEVVQVYANYFRAKAKHGGLVSLAERDLATDPDVTNVDLGSDKQTAWSIGLGIPVSEAGTVSLEYAQYKDYGGGSLLYQGMPMYASRAAPDGLDSAPGHKAKGYSIGYKHEMSKRTHLYAYVSRIDNDRGIDAGWEKTNVAGEKQTNFSVGIVHAF